MPLEVNTEEIINRLVEQAGSPERAVQLLQETHIRYKTSLAERAMQGAAVLAVNDWDRMQLFLTAGPDRVEAENFAVICRGVNEAIQAKDAQGLLRGLMLAYRITRAA